MELLRIYLQLPLVLLAGLTLYACGGGGGGGGTDDTITPIPDIPKWGCSLQYWR